MIHLRWVALVVLSLTAWFMPRLGDPWLARIERWGTRFAQKKWAAVVAIGATAILFRLALLPILPVPVPDTHDEFSYLLAADTFAHGRLTNPPHALPIYFETFHVLQRPTYQSMYPPAQSAVLAIGQLLGHPWIGVMVSMAIMCAAITWMLQAWLPAEWALLGGLLVIFRIYLFSYWLEGYWGGAVAAIGGALVMGALPRIRRQQRPILALVMGVGMALLANSRPFEGAIFAATVVVALFAWVFSGRGPALAISFRRIAIPIMLVMVPTVAFMGYYNWRVTGNALMFPHALDQREYEAVSPFVWKTTDLWPLWHATNTPRKYSNPQFEAFYNYWVWNGSRVSFARISREKVYGWATFFIGSVLWIPLLWLPFAFQDRRIRFLIIQFTVCAAGLLCVYWFNPHYAAPIAATSFAISMQCMRHLRRWEIKGRPIGVFVTRMLVLLVILRVAVYVYRPPAMKEAWSWSRMRISTELRRRPGPQLVLVHYSAGHNPHDEWVYNLADIDRSKIVWARQIPGVDLKPLLDYFPDRQVWLLDADAVPPRLRPFDRENMGPATLAYGQTSATRGQE